MVPLARGLRTPVRLPAVSPAEPMSGSVVLDAAGRRRSPATMPGFHAGHPPRNKGLRYPADPPTVEEIVAVMRIAGDGLHGRRLRGLIVVLWRAGLRIDEALALREADLDRRRGSILVRRGKGGRRREVGMDDWGWQELEPWLIARVALPMGSTFNVIERMASRDNVIPISTIVDIMEWMIEEWGGRPFQNPSASTSSRRSGGRKSTPRTPALT